MNAQCQHDILVLLLLALILPVLSFRPESNGGSLASDQGRQQASVDIASSQDSSHNHSNVTLAAKSAAPRRTSTCTESGSNTAAWICGAIDWYVYKFKDFGIDISMRSLDVQLSDQTIQVYDLTIGNPAPFSQGPGKYILNVPYIRIALSLNGIKELLGSGLTFIEIKELSVSGLHLVDEHDINPLNSDTNIKKFLEAVSQTWPEKPNNADVVQKKPPTIKLHKLDIDGCSVKQQAGFTWTWNLQDMHVSDFAAKHPVLQVGALVKLLFGSLLKSIASNPLTRAVGSATRAVEWKLSEA